MVQRSIAALRHSASWHKKLRSHASKKLEEKPRLSETPSSALSFFGGGSSQNFKNLDDHSKPNPQYVQKASGFLPTDRYSNRVRIRTMSKSKADGISETSWTNLPPPSFWAAHS